MKNGGVKKFRELPGTVKDRKEAKMEQLRQVTTVFVVFWRYLLDDSRTRPAKPLLTPLVFSEDELSRRRAPRRIRCPDPRCSWEPPPGTEWRCEDKYDIEHYELWCGFHSNPFDQPRCPRCRHQWRHIRCHKCLKFYPKERWEDG